MVKDVLLRILKKTISDKELLVEFIVIAASLSVTFLGCCPFFISLLISEAAQQLSPSSVYQRFVMRKTV